MNNINLLWCMWLEYNRKWGFKEHSHDFYQFFFITSGSNFEFIEIENQKIPLAENTLLVVKKNTLHKLIPVKNMPIRLIDIKFSTQDTELINILESFPIKVKILDEKISQLLSEIIQYWRKNNDLSNTICVCLLNLFILKTFESLKIFKKSYDDTSYLPKLIKDKNTILDNLTLKILNYIEINYKQEINLKILADNLHYSREYLCRIFKKNIGCTINYYINYLKILESIKLLKKIDGNIEQISEILNFSSSQYFSKVFKKFTGLSPYEFKQHYELEIVLNELEYGKFNYRYNTKK